MAVMAPTALWTKLRTAAPFFLIAGPNVLQGKDHALRIADHIAKLKEEFSLETVFKSSFDKANRTSLGSFRGPGMDEGLRILEAVKQQTGLPTITDIHEPNQASSVGSVVDIIQIPAFLCRQTDLLTAAAATGLPLHIKKGQFASPEAMLQAANKVLEAGNPQVMLGERGTTFGYSDLVVDPRNLVIMGRQGQMVVMDVTHCLQQARAPAAGKEAGWRAGRGGEGGEVTGRGARGVGLQPSARAVEGGAGLVSGGERGLLPHMGAMALALGTHGVFVEVDDNPSPPCDAKLQWPLSGLKDLLGYWKPFAQARIHAGQAPTA